jgi:hypothetical protein
MGVEPSIDLSMFRLDRPALAAGAALTPPRRAWS